MLIEFFNDGFSDLEFVIKLVLCNRDKVSFEFEKEEKVMDLNVDYIVGKN